MPQRQRTQAIPTATRFLISDSRSLATTASDLRAYDPTNGGVPQAPEANLTAHLHHVRGCFSGHVPPDFGGVCNIDFEGWQTNVWELIWCDRASSGNASHWQEYRNGYQTYSTLLIKRDHPIWSIQQCAAEAKTQ